MTATIDERLAERSAAAYGIAAERTLDPNLVDDVAQEVLIEMWKQLKRAEERGASDAQAVLNVAGKRRATRVTGERSVAWTGQPQRRPGGEHSAPRSSSLDAMTEDDGDWWMPASTDRVEDGVLARMEWERMKDRIMRLAPAQREAVVLHLQGLNSVEIAERVGITRQGVDNRLRHARSNLQDVA